MFSESIKQIKAAVEKLQDGSSTSFEMLYDLLGELGIKDGGEYWSLGTLTAAECIALLRTLQPLVSEYAQSGSENRVHALVTALTRRLETEKDLQHIRVFVSSPSDVSDERSLAFDVIEQIAYDPLLRGRITVEIVAWDKPGTGTPLFASMSPQEAIDKGLPKPSQCDIVITILWTRLGTPLGKEYVKPEKYHFKSRTGSDPSRYYSGTEWELVDSLEGAAKTGKPFVLVYRRLEEPLTGLNDPALNEKLAQYQLVEDFFAAFSEDDRVIRRGYNAYHKPADFKKQLELHLRDIISQLLLANENQAVPAAEKAAGGSLPEYWQGSPFPGLRAFGPEDAQIFFGRGNDVDGLLEKVKDTNFVAVVSASGAGKSSLVGAGLLPRLQKNAINGSRNWPLLLFSPDELGAGDVFASLSAALQRPPLNVQKPRLAETLRQSPDQLRDLLQQYVSDPWDRAFFFIDQFEEIFTRVKPADQGLFFDTIVSLVNSGIAKVVVTIRADFYSRCLESKSLEPLIKTGTYAIYAPKRDELREMIERPAEQAGLTFEPGLVKRILDDTGDEPGSLALMAFALQQLYEYRGPNGELKQQAYEDFGGVAGAIGRQAQKAFEAAPTDAQNALPKVFRHLIEVSQDGIPTRARAELSKITIDRPTELLINELVQQRLLVVNNSRENRTIVEVAHEALFRSWSRLANWIGEIGKDLAYGNRLTKEAQEWAATGRDPSFLLRGTRLEQATTWLVRAKLNSIVSEEQAQFISESLQEQEKLRKAEIRRGRRMLTVAGYSLLTLAVLAFFAWLLIGGYGQLFTRTQPVQYAAPTTDDYFKALLGVHTNQSWKPLVQNFADVPMVLVPAGCTSRLKSPEQVRQLMDVCQVDAEFSRNACAGMTWDTTPLNATQEQSMTCFDTPYWIDLYEVSNGQYGTSSLYQGENRPRDTINSSEAVAHCGKRDALLPTVAQWEYAGRGPNSLLFPWGNTFEKDFTNWDQHSAILSRWGDQFEFFLLRKAFNLENLSRDINLFAQSWNVGSNRHDVSWTGAYDMAGNLAEWVSSTETSNPYVLRSGSFWSDSFMTDLTYASYSSGSLPSFGFRCASAFEFPPEALSTLKAETDSLVASQTVNDKTGSDDLSRVWQFEVKEKSTVKIEFESNDPDFAVLVINSEGQPVARYHKASGAIYIQDLAVDSYFVYFESKTPTDFSVHLELLSSSSQPEILTANSLITSFGSRTQTLRGSLLGEPGKLALIEANTNILVKDPNGLSMVSPDARWGLLLLEKRDRYEIEASSTGKTAITVEVLEQRDENQIPLNVEKEFQGTLSTDNRRDYWFFHSQEDDTVAFVAVSDEFSPVLRIYSSTGKVVKAVDTGGEQSTLLLTIPESGLYLVEVSGKWPIGGHYTLNGRRLGTSDEMQLHANTRNEGVVDGGGSNRFWYFDGNKGETVSILADAGLVDPVLRIYDSAGALLAKELDNTQPNSLLVLKLPRSSRYYVEALVPPGQSGSYGLNMEVSKAAAENEIPPGGTVSEELASAQDQGFWYFKGYAGDFVSISMNARQRNSYFYLFNPQNQLVVSTRNAAPNRLKSSIYRIPSTGLYLIVTGTQSRTDKYDLSVSTVDPTSDLQLVPDELIKDHLGFDEGSETDYRFFTAEAGDIVSIELNTDNFNPRVSLFDPADNLVSSGEQNTPNNSFSSPSTNYGEAMRVPLQIPLSRTGTYRLEIGSWQRLFTAEDYSVVMHTVQLEEYVERNKPITGTLEQLSNVRMWRLDGMADEVIVIHVDSKGVMPRLELIDPSADMLIYTSLLDINDDQYLIWKLPENGQYILKASAPSNSTSPDSDSAFSFLVTSLEALQKKRVAFDESFRAALTQIPDQEFWFFTAERGEILKIATQSQNLYSFSIAVKDITGRVISQGIGNPIIVPSSGVYFIQLQGQGSDFEFTLQASGIQESPLGQTLQGELGQTKLQEEWFFKLNSGDLVSLSLVSPTTAIYTTIVDMNGNYVSTVPNFPAYANTSGYYKVIVSVPSGMTDINYSFRLDLLEPAQVDPLTDGQVASGTLTIDKPTAYWRIEAEAGDVFSAVATSEQFAPLLSIYNLRGQQINLLNSRDVLFPTAGSYIVRIGSSSGRYGDYTIEINDLVSDDSRYLTQGQKISSRLSIDRTQEFWYFHGDSADIIDLTSASKQFKPTIALFDPGGKILTPVGSTYQLPRAGNYLIRVMAPTQVYGDYELTMEQSSARLGKTIVQGQSVTGSLTDDDVQEFWLFEAQAGEILSIKATSDSFAPTLAVFDLAGQHLSTSPSPFIAPKTGTYALKIGGFPPYGDYTAEINRVASDSSRYLQPGESITSDLSANKLEEYWFFEGKAGDIFSITGKSEQFTPNVTLFALKELKQYLTAGKVLLSVSDTYLVRISTLSDELGSYSLELTRSPLDASRQLLPGQDAAGRLSSSNPQEYWFLDAKAGDVFSIIEDSGQPNLFFNIIDPQFKSLPSNPSSQPFVVSKPGRYIVRAGKTNPGTVDYSLRLNLQPAGVHKGLSISEGVASNLSAEQPWEAWVVQGNARESLMLKMTSRDLNQPKLQVYDPRGQPLGSSYVNLEAAFGFITLPTTGSYTIVASASSYSFASNEYRLEANQIASAPTNRLTEGKKVSGMLSESSSLDYWFVQGDTDEILSISVKTDLPDIGVSVLGPDGSVLASRAEGKAASSYAVYFTNSEEYRLFAMPKIAGESLVLVNTAGKTEDSYELEVFSESVSRLERPAAVDGQLDTDDPQDFYFVDAKPGDVLWVRLSDLVNIPQIRIWNPDGAVLYSNENMGPLAQYQFGPFPQGKLLISIQAVQPGTVSYKLELVANAP